MHNCKQKIALVTGAAGFIGFYISKLLLDEGWRVIGIDYMSDYYDVTLKEQRECILLKNASYRSIHENIATSNILLGLFNEERPDVVIHCAAQAGVRSSIENPHAYLNSNIHGTFELLEAARAYPPGHMVIASSSSVYGASKQLPYKEDDRADHQISFYAATKKATENIAHSYSHLYKLPITMFRFFTVYGPWGRPDMALFKFTESIVNNEAIDVFNFGKMSRDFTYIDDLVHAIRLLLDAVPTDQLMSNENMIWDKGKSSVAPFRVVNIGNSKPAKLLDFIVAIENSTGKKAIKNLIPMQAGDVSATWADVSVLERLTGYKPDTDIASGIDKFVAWYKEYYDM